MGVITLRAARRRRTTRGDAGAGAPVRALVGRAAIVDVRASDVAAAFDAGTILRTHVLRPTWHFAAQDDLRWLLALTGPILERRNARRDRELELDARTRRRATDLIADAVRTGPLTRRELAEVLEQHGITTDGQRIAHLLFHAELHAAVCSGPMRGKVHTYAAFDTRVPPGVAHEGEAALAELARRWFTTRGPATLRDFAWWSGLPMAAPRAGLAAVQSELTSFARDDRTYWFADVAKRVRGPRVDLVQCYDETIISYTRVARRPADARCRVPRPVQHQRLRACAAVRRSSPRSLARGWCRRRHSSGDTHVART